ncbi:hypothetical protein BCR39DRAFT_532135 [Naematelia encephala]|uniref:CUE domain-containing protein n=1 Tax=Naematelia encephala TaxID=71784 RepID=A0A1Y2B414_9TREE|nr:hypothetical protein BCR39DRAFT_532135 [Naematelia encephala]
MAMEDVLPALLVIGLVWVLIRYMSRSSNTSTLNRDGIIGVTPAMVETVHSAFPHIPPGNIIYSLSKTRSAQATSEEIIERGFLPIPPATFNIPASLLPPSVNPPTPTSPTKPTLPSRPVPSLIERYQLSSRIPSRKGKEKDEEDSGAGAPGAAPGGGVGGEAVKWEDTREGREKGLKERKERMILEARRRLLEKQASATEQQTTQI